MTGPTRRGPIVRQLGAAFLLLNLFHLAAPPLAAAYIDPLSGSIVVQVAAAAVLGAAVGMRRSWQAVREFFRRVLGRPVP